MCQAYHVMDFHGLFRLDGTFWVMLKILDQMGLVCLVMDLDGTLGIIQEYFG